ncbi:hypothetical protein [Streptomyces sp. NPDC057428]|uniref:hypothetical protein n=1 Tax=Streptomyces sp. NPDC057428 TaxID=3346129 RepID=UPI0036C444C4
MPNLNVLTWNSTGETVQGALGLRQVIQHLAANNSRPHVIVIQEAHASPGGPVYDMLAGLGAPYNGPAHATEGVPGGRGYLLATHDGVGGQATFARCDLAADQGLQGWLNDHLVGWARTDADQELAGMRMPATANLTFHGTRVRFMTWHAPLGPGRLLPGTLGEANPDAYLFLQRSSAYTALSGPDPGGLGLIAGDLNVTVQQLNTKTGLRDLPMLLPGWAGVSNKLDHIVGHSPAGQHSPAFSGAGNFLASGAHNVLISSVIW